MRQVHFIIFLFSHSTLKMHFFLKKLNLSHKQWELNHSIGETELFITLCHLWCVWNPIIASNYLNYLYASRKHIVHSTEISFHYLPSFIVHSTEMTSYRSFMFLFEKWEVGVGPSGEDKMHQNKFDFVAENSDSKTKNSLPSVAGERIQNLWLWLIINWSEAP